MRGALNCGDQCGMIFKQEFVDKLKDLERMVKFELVINSGPRCQAHNATITQNKNSAHTLGLAADIAVANSHERFLLIRAIYSMGFRRIGRSDKRKFIHIDIAEGPVPFPTETVREFPLFVDWSYDG